MDRDGRFVPNCNSFFQNDSATVSERSLGRNEHPRESDMKPKLLSSAGVAASDAPAHRGSCRAFGGRWIVAFALSALSSAHAFGDRINGQVLGAGAPIVGSTVTLWAAGPGAPQLAQTQTGADGGFVLDA